MAAAPAKTPILNSGSSSLLICYLLFPLIVFHLFLATAGADTKRDYVALHPPHLKPSPFCSPPKGQEQGGLLIAHRYGPCSPVGQANLSEQEFLTRDQTRVRWLQTRLSTPAGLNTTTSAIPAKLGTAVGTLNYVVTVGLGTPSRPLTLAFDTGSDLTWTQCRPCTGHCYNQSDPIFDPAASSTYRNFTCYSPDCSALRSGTGRPTSCTAPSTCVYSTSYGDGSATVGFYARDTLALGPDAIQSFRFGCGINNSGLFGFAAGLLALGRDDVSLVSQSAPEYGRRFSYCLPSTSSSASGFLKFGSAVTATAAKFTPMLRKSEEPSFYFLELTGIFVAGERLNIPESSFSSTGTIIDSGTVISRLPSAAYSALRSVFRLKMTAYKLTNGYRIFDTCYDLSGNVDLSIPKIVLRFGGNVDVDIDVSGILYFANDRQTCLAFASSDADEVAIIGNQQQRTYEVVYDVAGGKIGFAAGSCD